MTLIQKIGTLSISATIASSTGAYLNYSSRELVEEKQDEQKEVKFSDPFVWASFKGKEPKGESKLPEQPLSWF